MSKQRGSVQSVGNTTLDRGGGLDIKITLDEDLGIAAERNKLVCPISEEIVPFRKLIKEDPRPPLTFDISLPFPPDPNQPPKVLSFWQNLLRNNKNIIRTAFTNSLNCLLNQGIIKRFKDMSAQSFYWDHPYNLSDRNVPLDEFSLIDFVKTDFYQIGYASFEVALPHDGTFKAPSQVIGDSESSFDFINANYPWEIRLHSADIKNLKKQDNYRFKVFVGINFPLLYQEALLSKQTCKHNFRLLYLGVWEWRLVWECKNCGFTCYCSCFEKAIKANPYEKVYLEVYGKKINIRPSELPFHEKACEICRGQPSSNIFCHEMYARSIFEIRYGAYVKKRMIELKLGSYGNTNEEELEVVANNLVRKELGFPAIGEKWITETELYRIIKSLFPNLKVVHHYRGQWLEGLELDIYIPDENLGIEYHGTQHFEPIEAWGGEEGLAKTRERDIRKFNICKKNNARLIIFTYEENIDLNNVKKKLIEAGCNFT